MFYFSAKYFFKPDTINLWKLSRKMFETLTSSNDLAEFNIDTVAQRCSVKLLFIRI